MRNFIVLFMIFILFSSVFFVIVMPARVKEKEVKPAEKSHVEKLLSEPAATNDDIKEFAEPERNITDIFDEVPNAGVKKVTQNEDLNSQNEQKTQPFVNEERKIKNVSEQVQTDKKLQDISRELSEKYGNNPNAEVSEEDFNNFMINMLKSVQQQ